MNNLQDYGFRGKKFQQERITPPYCQFFNENDEKYGLAITSANANAARFTPSSDWLPIKHQFRDGTDDILQVTNIPRMVVLNRSIIMMNRNQEIIPYDKTRKKDGFAPFSYVIVWFLDHNNQPLSELPFRLKCSGFAGYTFLQHYNYANNDESFCQKFLRTYKHLTQDRAINKNEIFYAHAIYCARLSRRQVESSENGQRNKAVITTNFINPTEDNFGSLIIKNQSPVSLRIQELIETTKSWLKTEIAVPQKEEATESH